MVCTCTPSYWKRILFAKYSLVRYQSNWLAHYKADFKFNGGCELGELSVKKYKLKDGSHSQKLQKQQIWKKKSQWHSYTTFRPENISFPKFAQIKPIFSSHKSLLEAHHFATIKIIVWGITLNLVRSAYIPTGMFGGSRTIINKVIDAKTYWHNILWT